MGFCRYLIAILLLFSLLAGLSFRDGGRMAKGLPTPWLGVWERVTIFAYLVDGRAGYHPLTCPCACGGRETGYTTGHAPLTSLSLTHKSVADDHPPQL